MIKILQLSDSQNYQVIYDERLGSRYLQQLRQQFTKLRQGGEKIGLVTFLDKIPKVSGWKSFKELVKMKVAALGVIDKYAIITSKKWMRKWARLADILTPRLKVKVFAQEDAQQALAWLSNRPRQLA